MKLSVRVGLFTESYDPVINGVSTSVKTLAAQLLAAGHEPVIVAPRFPGYADPPASATVAPVIRLMSWRTPFNPANPFAWPPVGPEPRVLRQARFDLVHTQQPFGLGQHGRRSALCAHAPLVSTFHTLYTEYSHYLPFLPKKPTRLVIGKILSRYYNGCAAVIVPSHAAGDLLTGVGVRGDLLHVVPTGVPPASLVSDAAIAHARATYALPPDAPVLLFVGRLAREKNLPLLLDAFARLCTEYGEAADTERPLLLLVGSGPYSEECERLVQASGITAQVRFTGLLAREQLAAVYALATLFVFPSITETQGVVLSEAQSYGLPCVVVDGGGAPEFVRADKDALIVPNDASALAHAMGVLLRDRNCRAAFALAARESPLRPTPADMVGQMLGIYAQVRHTAPGQTAALTPPAR